MSLEQCKNYISNKDSVRELLECMGYEITPQYKFKDNPSMSIRNDGYIKDFGNSSFNGGDLLDFMKFEFNEQLPQSVERLSNMLNISSDNKIPVYNPPIKKKEDKEPLELQREKINKLNNEAPRYLKGTCFKGYPGTKLLKLNDTKLFQRETIDLSYFQKLRYLSENILGYDDYFKCTKIILKDSSNNVVDFISYRPKDPKGTQLPKYMQLSNEKKPIKRGDNFIYPFQIEMEELIKEKDFILIGEGLKNSINALLYSIPYLSIESVSKSFSEKFKDYIYKLKNSDIKIIGAFDGDIAGGTAYKRFCDEVYIIDNLFAFDSGIDFTDYVIKKEVTNA